MNLYIDGTFTIFLLKLALKHRQNKNQHQRIVVFIGSPINNTTEELVRLGKRLKKNNIAVDVVNFGEETSNTEKLEALIAAVNNSDNRYLLLFHLILQQPSDNYPSWTPHFV
jgi:26S proteasome regulatory subunit N10